MVCVYVCITVAADKVTDVEGWQCHIHAGVLKDEVQDWEWTATMICGLLMYSITWQSRFES
jgi:hypothetical protein